MKRSCIDGLTRLMLLLVLSGLFAVFASAQTKSNSAQKKPPAENKKNAPPQDAPPQDAPRPTGRLPPRRRPLPDWQPRAGVASPKKATPSPTVEESALAVDPDTPNISGPDHALYDAVVRGDLGAVKALLRLKKINVNIKKNGMTPLLLAVSRPDADAKEVEILKLLLESGANVKVRNRRNETGLYLAVEQSQPEMVRLLLAHKADPYAIVHDPAKAETAGSLLNKKLRGQPRDAKLAAIEKLLKAAKVK